MIFISTLCMFCLVSSSAVLYITVSLLKKFSKAALKTATFKNQPVNKSYPFVPLFSLRKQENTHYIDLLTYCGYCGYVSALFNTSGSICVSNTYTPHLNISG